MTNFMHWRKMTWVLVLWCAALTVFLPLAGSSAIMVVGGLWLVAAAGLTVFWFLTAPLIQQGRGFRDGFFLKPGPGNWRLVNLHRTY